MVGVEEIAEERRMIMAKQKLTELYTPYPDTGGKLTDNRSAVIRVRKEIWRGGSRYVMNHWLPVPAARWLLLAEK
jgi:hypothetical protein